MGEIKINVSEQMDKIIQKVIDDLGLRDKVKFLGHVDLKKEFPKIDVLVLTSISEAQPLVMLEAGFFGVPCVATNVGACKQLLYGSVNESPSLGQGGIVTPLANPEATAEAIIKLMTDKDFYKSCSRVFAERIRKYYRIEEHHAEYKKIYNKHLEAFNQGDN